MRKNKYYEKLIDENLVFEDEDTEPDEENLKPYDPEKSRDIVSKTQKTVLLLIAALTVLEVLIVLLFVLRYGNGAPAVIRTALRYAPSDGSSWIS